MRDNMLINEDAVKTVVDAANSCRLEKCNQELTRQQHNKLLADQQIDMMKQSCNKVIETNRGGDKGIHGFLGERAQCYLSNAVSVVSGDDSHYSLCDNNGPTDYYYDNIPVQQKACRAGGNYGLDQIERHMNDYKGFEEQGIYQIPSDFYEDYRKYSNMPESIAYKLRREELRKWTKVHKFNRCHPNTKIQPMIVDYSSIQREEIYGTIQDYEHKIDRIHDSRCKEIIDNNKPSCKEGATVAAISGVTNASSASIDYVFEKFYEGKKPWNYNKAEWIELGKRAGMSFLSGLLYGALDYVHTNI